MTSPKTQECTDFKNKLNKQLMNSFRIQSPEDNIGHYFRQMGKTIQSLYEDKKIDFHCRTFSLYYLHKKFFPSQENDKLSEYSLAYYSIASEYGKEDLKAVFSTGSMLSKEGISFANLDNHAEKMHLAAQTTINDKESIPKTLNSIWLTSAINPREIHQKDLENVFYNKKFIESNTTKWKYVLWTNDKNLIVRSIKELEKYNVEVKSIYDEALNLSLKTIIDQLIVEKKYGMASDVLRYEIIAKNGGVYVDLNFRFLLKLDEYINKYDFFTADTRNNFFAAKAYHPILLETLEKISSNFADLPIYIEDYSVESTIRLTHLPFVLKMLTHSNLNGNSDFYYDYYYAYNKKEDKGPLGEDSFGTSKTWKNIDQDWENLDTQDLVGHAKDEF